MKKILFFCLIALFASCSAEEELQGMSAESTAMLKELENVANGYELMIKGYTLEEIQKEKDETQKNDRVETTAEPWMIKAIQDSLNKQVLSYGSKTRADAQPFGGSAPKVGVFKYTTCGNNREFVYFMDCEDGGNTHKSGDIGSSEVDRNGNVRFRFCLVNPGAYGGGVLLLCDYSFGVNNQQNKTVIIERYHDNQDSNNQNGIEDNGGLTYTGLTHFSANTRFFWIYDGTGTKLPFSYGVLSYPLSIMQDKVGIISIDDENSRNGNSAYIHTWGGKQNLDEHPVYKGCYDGIEAGINTQYFIKYMP